MQATQDGAPGVQGFLGDAGALPEIHWAGKVWKIGFPTQRAKAALEELAAARAVSEVVALKAALEPAAYAEMFAAVRRAIGAKEYRTWGAGWASAVNGPDGGTLFLLSLLRERHADATEADARGLAEACPDEVAAALDRVIAPFFDLLAACYPGPTEAKGKVYALMLEKFRAPRTPTS